MASEFPAHFIVSKSSHINPLADFSIVKKSLLFSDAVCQVKQTAFWHILALNEIRVIGRTLEEEVEARVKGLKLVTAAGTEHAVPVINVPVSSVPVTPPFPSDVH